MATEVKLPEVGDNIEQGSVVSVLVKPGDSITAGQAIIEIETDKAVVEVPSSEAGTVAEVRVKEGDTVPVGGVILTLDGGGQSPAASSQPKEEAKAPAPTPQPQAAQPTPQPQAAAPASGGSTDVTLPEVGDNIEQGTIVSVLVKPGDSITAGQAVVEIETDKAVVEVPSNAAGTVAEVKVKEGDSVKVGGVLLTLSGATSAPAPQPAPSQGGGNEATGAEGATVAPDRGTAQQVGSAQQEAQKAQATQVPAPASQPATPPRPAQTFDGRQVVPAAPSVRRLAREIGVDIHAVHGTGIAGRISEEDVRRTGGQPTVTEAASGQQPAASSTASTAAGLAPLALPDFAKWGQVRVEEMSGIRKATVRSMTGSWTHIPMVTHFDKADVTRMEEVRRAFGARVEKAGGKLTMTVILMKVVANALRKFPKFNASIDVEKSQVIFKDYVSLGVAVDTPNGLLVPVMRDVDRKSITELAVEIGEIAAKARDRKLKPDEMQGATFTISNLGGIGGYAFTPIVNHPEVAILGVSRGGMEPVWNKDTGEFEPRNMLPVSLTYDHRLIDGADAARFVRYICESLEDPFLISL